VKTVYGIECVIDTVVRTHKPSAKIKEQNPANP
jgi:hypothetical protein